MEFLFIAVLIGLIPAAIAAGKGSPGVTAAMSSMSSTKSLESVSNAAPKQRGVAIDTVGAISR